MKLSSLEQTRFVKWRGGNRRLTIIDEALANVVENNKVTLTDLAQALSYIQLDLQRAFPEQIKVLEELHAVLVSNADPACPDHHTARMLWDDSHPIQIPDMAALSSAMKLLRYDELVLNEHNDSSRTKIARKVSETIASAAAVTTQWAYYAQRGTEHSINASSFLIPWDVPGPVVLDATANANFLWDLLGTRSQTIPTPPKARNYENVTLHVARASGLGKHSMIKASKARLPRLLAALEKELGSERSVFLCMHKATEHLAHTYAPRFKEFDVGHWGAVDGRNTWQDYDTAVIFGLAHLMSNRPTGETALSYIRAELSLDKGALKRLKETLRDPNNPTTAALSDRGVSYLVKGAGRGAKTYLVKHAA